MVFQMKVLHIFRRDKTVDSHICICNHEWFCFMDILPYASIVSYIAQKHVAFTDMEACLIVIFLNCVLCCQMTIFQSFPVTSTSMEQICSWLWRIFINQPKSPWKPRLSYHLSSRNHHPRSMHCWCCIFSNDSFIKQSVAMISTVDKRKLGIIVPKICRYHWCIFNDPVQISVLIQEYVICSCLWY